tara:strand:- start:1220 stop:1966 length:747 start_codon:yes stop_codon:yes gene_type:complete
MNRILVLLLAFFLVIGIVFGFSFVLADDNNETDTDDDSDSDEDDDEDESENEVEIEEENGKKKIKVKTRFTDENGVERRIKYEIETKTEDGEEVSIIKYKSKAKGEKMIKSEIELEAGVEGNESIINAILSNGEQQEIKILPEQASEKARLRFRSGNITVELKEKKHKNVPRVVYNVETNKNGRFLGILKLKMKVEGEIDPETGEFLGVSKPWWAFLVTGEDSDQTDDNGDGDSDDDDGNETEGNETS